MLPILGLGFVTTVLGAILSYQQGRWFFSILYLGLYSLLLLSTILRNHFSFSVRTSLLLIAIFFISVIMLLRLGLSGIGMQGMIAACVLAAVLVGIRTGLFTLGLCLVVAVLIAVGMVSGRLPIYPEQMLTSLSSVQWLIALLVFSMTTLGLIVIPQMMVARLKESLVLLEKRTLRLKRANEVLRRQIRTRREAERALRESEERFRTVYQAIPDPVTLIRLDDERCVDVNDEFLRLTGWGKEEVVGKTAADLSIWCDPKNRAKMIEEIHRSGRAENVQAQFRMKDGGIIIGLFSAMSLMIGGKPHLISITRDITERYRAEKALKESEEKYRLVVDNANEGIILTQGGKVVFTNGRAITRSGYSVDELYRTDLAEFLHPEDREAAINRYLSIMAGKESKGSHEYRIMDKWGKTRWVRSHSVRVNWLGEPALITFMNEITQQKEMEAEREKLQARLQRAEKMEAIGTLAGGVAHDLNNVLSGIVSYPDLLLMQLPEESPLRKSIVTMRESGKRAAAIVQDLLTLARRGVATTELVNLNAVIRDYLQSPEHERLHALHPHVQVESLLDHHLLNVVGSPLHLQKTVMNLVSNALEAMPQGGTVLISTENRYMDRPLNAYDHVRRGDYVVMTVSDTGIGILPQDRERIFEPFYTKKAMGRSGTGLGMAVVWGTVKDHGAKIDVESVEGKGTTFIFQPPGKRWLQRIHSFLRTRIKEKVSPF
jgi:PAS domain S-box-containing protein